MIQDFVSAYDLQKTQLKQMQGLHAFRNAARVVLLIEDWYIADPLYSKHSRYIWSNMGSSTPSSPLIRIFLEYKDPILPNPASSVHILL